MYGGNWNIISPSNIFHWNYSNPESYLVQYAQMQHTYILMIQMDKE